MRSLELKWGAVLLGIGGLSAGCTSKPAGDSTSPYDSAAAVGADTASGVEDSGDSGDGGDSSGELDTWSTFAADFFQTYCVECHDSGERDFQDYKSVIANAESIRCGTAAVTQDGCGSWPPAQQFPVGGGPFPDDSDRDRLVAWIDAGLPQQ